MPTKQRNLVEHAKTSLGYFILAAFLGMVLRAFHSFEIPITYKFFVHTHSHIALLGWVYLGLTTLLFKLYLTNSGIDKRYKVVFWFTQLTLVGMLLTFPFQGYALFSILFSTLFLFASYWFVGFFLKNVPSIFKTRNSYRCVKVALWYLVFSSLGPWALGAIMNFMGAQSVWYRLAIYFYLHFFYNGWMVMALVGILFYIMETNRIHMRTKAFKRFFLSVNLAIILTFFLSTLFADPPVIFNLLGGTGALLQIFAFTILFIAFARYQEKIRMLFSKFQYGLLRLLLVLFIVKIALQLLTSFPYFAHLAAVIVDFTIGYLHWTFLGVVTIGLFLCFDYFKLLTVSKRAYIIYLTGFVLTESLLFYKGIVAWKGLIPFESYYDVLTAGSFLIVLALILVFTENFKTK